jgi:GT2 family glycosyltransferase
LQERLTAAGCEQVYLPEAEVWHYVPTSSCTPAWALHREYRKAITAAIQQDTWYRSSRWFGAPGWLWANLAIALVHRLQAHFVSDEERRFRLRRPYHQYRGFLRGRRLRSSGRALPGGAGQKLSE